MAWVHDVGSIRAALQPPPPTVDLAPAYTTQVPWQPAKRRSSPHAAQHDQSSKRVPQATRRRACSRVAPASRRPTTRSLARRRLPICAHDRGVRSVVRLGRLRCRHGKTEEASRSQHADWGYGRPSGQKTTTQGQGETARTASKLTAGSDEPTEEFAVGDEAPPRRNAKKPNKSLKEKRSDKQAKRSEKRSGFGS